MVDRSPCGAKESCPIGMLDRELLSTLHGADSKIAFLSKLGVRRRNWLIFSRHYGFEDGTTWSYGRLAKHYRISEQRVGQIVSSVVDKIKEYARTHA